MYKITKAVPTLGKRNSLNVGIISFNRVSEIPDPITVLMGVFHNIVGGVIIIGGVICFNGVKFYR